MLFLQNIDCVLLKSFHSWLKLTKLGYRCKKILSNVQHDKHKKDNVDSEWDPSKAKLIQAMNFKALEDAKPFYMLSNSHLYNIYVTTKNDVQSGFCNNRLYFIAENIQCPPAKLSERVVEKPFIYKMSFERLRDSLFMALDMGVSGERIFRDLWILNYSKKTIRERLLKLKELDIDVQPWMVRCPEQALNRSVQIKEDTKSILGNMSQRTYLAQRLNTDEDHIEMMYKKVPSLRTCRAIKIKSFLDFLVSEGYSAREVALQPRILGASQRTVARKLQLLRAKGEPRPSLGVLSRGQKLFERYLSKRKSDE